ncbi:MAG TPA: hypothetical protein VFA75_06620 [Nevskia sp.]|nr:hypothetical protein [Nevskia sp.]
MGYSIVFTGKIRPGATLSETRGNLAGMYKITNEALLDKVFSGKPVILKKGLSEDEARSQEMILLMAGAVCELRNDAPPPAPPAPMEAPPAAAPTPIAPVAVPPALASTTGLALMPEPRRPEPEPPVPAALRGMPRDVEAEQRAAAGARGVVVTNHGRDGEALLDPMQAPWDPAFMPDGARGLSWAGFMAPLLWGSFNGMRLSFVPIIGIRLLRHVVPAWGWGVFLLGFGGFYLIRGRELAWRNKQWRNGEHFNRVQRYWNFGAAALFLLTAYGLVHLTLLDRRAERMASAATAVALADEAVARAASPEARSQAVTARNLAREQLLAAIDDPATREREQQNFAAQDREETESQAAAAAEPEADSPPSSE